MAYPTVVKPSRSDEVVDSDQQLRIANQIRAHFDSMCPKRSTKPNRSESDSALPPPGTLYVDGIIPELEKLKSLQSESQVVFSTENGAVQDDFTETEYYKELESVEKQHHTTGTGFIKVEDEGAETGPDYDFPRVIHNEGERKTLLSAFRSNPATNDWIPSAVVNQVACPSSKPIRSG
ncbi:hypothetical protein Nepgr_016657 [Nepenthes gracilis]|uniref:Uncharacterized protein n=1 Tax=Nepenthes gracilis TaxID=150966 RepID=A0AAD3SQQ1_NEPGR|nr:hypothetical protein Nepgr_016657 [Nepenthes gracilis]